MGYGRREKIRGGFLRPVDGGLFAVLIYINIHPQISGQRGLAVDAYRDVDVERRGAAEGDASCNVHNIYIYKFIIYIYTNVFKCVMEYRNISVGSEHARAETRALQEDAQVRRPSLASTRMS